MYAVDIEAPLGLSLGGLDDVRQKQPPLELIGVPTELQLVKIASWNVNSLRARHDAVLAWVRAEAPDILCLQETKVTDDEFPTDELHRLGYAVASAGQKSYNGVAIVAKKPLEDIRVGLFDAGVNDESRLISAVVSGIRVFSCYVPNGRSVDSEAFQEKLRWLERLKRTLELWTQPSEACLLAGDFNIAADARDVFDVESFAGKTHFHPEEHLRLRALLEWGLTDAFRLHNTQPGLYSWWDYRAGAFRRNLGMRIDYLFVSEPLVKRCRSVSIDTDERAKPKPSDHAPVVGVFSDE